MNNSILERTSYTVEALLEHRIIQLPEEFAPADGIFTYIPENSNSC